MSMPSRNLPKVARRAALAAIAGTALLGGSSAALAVPSAPGPVTGPGDPTNLGTVAFGWGPATPAGVAQIIRYEWSVNGDAAPAANTTGPAPPLASGDVALSANKTYVFSVHAVEQVPGGIDDLLTPEDESLPGPEVPGPDATYTFARDTVPPAVGLISPGAPDGAHGWFTSEFTLAWTCTGAIAGCPNPLSRQVTLDTVSTTVNGTASDAAGNATPWSYTYKLDQAPPPATSLASPSDGATVKSAPKLTWSESPNPLEGSKFERFEVWREGASEPLHVINDPTGKSTSFTPSGLPEQEQIHWYVRSVDGAGNTSDSGTRSFVIDPTAPPPPTINSGPPAQTNDTTPSFSWSGGQPGFRWRLIRAGETTPIQQGEGNSATVAALGNGTYTMSVVQVSAAGVEGAEATHTFTVDTVAPARPVVTGPTTPKTDIAQRFTWTGEPHARYTFRVIGANGSIKQGPATLTATAVTTIQLSPSTYTFELRQTDRAGNTSDAAQTPFSVTAPQALLQPVANLAGLPLRSTRRLAPRAGTIVMTRRPTLRWARGPRRTTLYNLQLFRVERSRKTKKLKRVVKVMSAYPRTRKLHLSARRTRPSTCYVWRVWPYLGRKFARKPVGVSSFCIASRRALKVRAEARASKTP